MSYLRGIDTESSASAIEFAPKTFSGHCGRPSFEIKRSSYLILSTRASKFPSLPSCSGYRHERLKEEWQNTACPFQVQWRRRTLFQTPPTTPPSWQPSPQGLLHVAFRNPIPYEQRCTIPRSAQSSVKFNVETRMLDCDASISHWPFSVKNAERKTVNLDIEYRTSMSHFWGKMASISTLNWQTRIAHVNEECWIVYVECWITEVEYWIVKRSSIQSINVANQNLNFGGDITPYRWKFQNNGSLLYAWFSEPKAWDYILCCRVSKFPKMIRLFPKISEVLKFNDAFGIDWKRTIP